MPEGMAGEVAKILTEETETHESHERQSTGYWDALLAIVEVVALSVVALTTAYAGYQAARWDGQQSLLYGQASSDRFAADAASTLGGQTLLGDATIFTAYLQAHAAANNGLEALLVRRFSPPYRVAFAA